MGSSLLLKGKYDRYALLWCVTEITLRFYSEFSWNLMSSLMFLCLLLLFLLSDSTTLSSVTSLFESYLLLLAAIFLRSAFFDYFKFYCVVILWIVFIYFLLIVFLSYFDINFFDFSRLCDSIDVIFLYVYVS